jgi:hypothetical protein
MPQMIRSHRENLLIERLPASKLACSSDYKCRSQGISGGKVGVYLQNEKESYDRQVSRKLTCRYVGTHRPSDSLHEPTIRRFSTKLDQI